MSRPGWLNSVFTSFVVLLAIGFPSASGAQANANAKDDQAKPAADLRDKAPADTTKKEQKANQANEDSSGDPLKRPVDEKRRKENARNLRKELRGEYRKWLDEDVRWIISDEERKAFMQLSNDEERDQFIEAFWQRRNPDPDSEDNAFKEEHYRRIAYANEHFAAGIPGWKSDRGHMYIAFGPPDEIESHAGGGTYTRPMEEGGGETSTYPFEDWRYRYLEGIGQEAGTAVWSTSVKVPGRKAPKASSLIDWNNTQN